MTDTKTKTQAKYPKAVYAAAGVGDFVYEQLRRLQDKAIAFGTEAGAQAPQWRKKVAELATTVDAGKVREGVVTGTQFAADKAGKLYDTLVTRGEKAFAAAEPAAKAEKTEKADDKADAEAAPVAKKATVAKKAAPRKTA
jgi:hypothetical protein